MLKRQHWLLLLCLVLAYPLLTWLTLHFYPDNPETMVWDDREAFNHKYIAQLNLSSGTSLDQTAVIARLGGPDITEATQSKDVLYQLLYYRTQRAISDGITTKAECTPLLFRNRQLIAIAEQAEQQYRALVSKP